MDKLIELCAQCAKKLEKGLEITNMRLDRRGGGMIRCAECGRSCWGSSYRLRKQEPKHG